MRRVGLAVLILCGAAACQNKDGAKDSISYRCDNGRRFHVQFNEYQNTMTVSAGGTSTELPQAISASGARYARGGREFWSKGEEAMLNGFPGGPFENCKISK